MTFDQDVDAKKAAAISRRRRIEAYALEKQERERAEQRAAAISEWREQRARERQRELAKQEWEEDQRWGEGLVPFQIKPKKKTTFVRLCLQCLAVMGRLAKGLPPTSR